jgi:hypothetical protein
LIVGKADDKVLRKQIDYAFPRSLSTCDWLAEQAARLFVLERELRFVLAQELRHTNRPAAASQARPTKTPSIDKIR